MSNREVHFIRWRGSTIADARRFGGFRHTKKIAETCSRKSPSFYIRFFGNDAARDELGRFACRRKAACIIAKESNMRNKILAITAIAAAMSAPIAAAQAQDTVGVVRGGNVVINGDIDGIPADQRPAFHEYIVREHVPAYTIPDRVVVGGVLPETGVTYYDVPQTFGVTPYRYTVVNGRTILVEPRSRRIVQVVE
jgi:hypothetical protein